MPLDDLRAKIPPYAEDIDANLASVAQDAALTERQKWGALLACAYAVGEPTVVREIERAAEIDESARSAAKSAAAIESMNNIYFRATNTLSNTAYKTMPPGLSMNALARPGVDRLDFELWSFAVSAINGCGVCMDSHETELRKNAAPPERVQAALRIAAVVNAASRILAAESALDDGDGQES